MTTIFETSRWDDAIHLIQRGERVSGGRNGVANIQASQLANRTQYLRAQLDSVMESGEFANFTFLITADDPDGTLAGLAATTNGKIFRVAQGAGSELSFIYYVNDGGRAVPVAEWLGGAALDSVKRNDGLMDVTADADVIDKYVIYADGSVTTNGDGWRGLFFQVKAGEEWTYRGSMGSVIVGDDIAVMWQLDSRGNKIVPLVKMTSDGKVIPNQTFTATATEDGLIYIRARSRDADGNLLSFNVYRRRPFYIPGRYMDTVSGQAYATVEQLINGRAFRELGAEAGYFGNTFMYVDGSINSATTSWRAYKIPVKAGDRLRYDGPYGSNIVGFMVGLAIQLDTAGNFIRVLHPVFGTGEVTRREGIIFTAGQDGFIWINARTAYSTDIKIYREEPHSWIDNTAWGETTDYVQIDNTVIEGDSITKTPANGEQHAVYVRVREGDTVTYFGSHGSLSAGQVIDMIIQLDEDKKPIEVLAQHVSRGTTAFYTYSSAVAKQDGWLYVRARFSDFRIFTKHRAFAREETVRALSRTVSTLPATSCQMERLPVRLDNTWNFNATAFIQDQIIEEGEYLYAVVTAQGRLPHIMQRHRYGGAWSVFDLSQVPDLIANDGSGVLKSPTTEDGHNVAVMGITREGYILVAANHHGNPWRCVISERPHDISAWKRAPFATDSKVVTYPRFTRYPDGTLHAFWREGSSGNGVYYGATFNDETMLFNPKVLLIDAQASNPYEQRIVIDDEGTLHLCWGYRTESQDANTNFGLFYAKSTDKGATFTSADGSQQYALPLSGSNAEKIIDAPAGSGYCNQNGACHDLQNNYHTVIWQYDRDGATQICHIWFDGTQWQRELVSDFTFAVALNVPTLDGSLCRPLIFCTNLGRLYVAYHTTEMGRQNDIRVIDVTEPGAPVDYCVAKYDVGTIELSINTDMVKRSGELSMLLTRGASGAERPGYKRFVSESGWLMTVTLPENN